MINVASRAKNGINIPGRKATRGEIKYLFKDHLTRLKAKLDVSIRFSSHSFLIFLQGPTVQGEVSLTCDAWQASNADGYFAVTAHWIEEPTPAKWELKSALIGFTWLNNAHNGKRLGQALFKVIKRMGIEHKVSISYHRHPAPLNVHPKVGHVTCDNASNNSTMMKELAARLKITMSKEYHWKKRKIKSVSSQTSLFQLLTADSCLAHVINLATQMLISTYSKSPYFDPKEPDAHVPTYRDEVGLVRAIVIKVWVMSVA